MRRYAVFLLIGTVVGGAVRIAISNRQDQRSREDPSRPIASSEKPVGGGSALAPPRPAPEREVAQLIPNAGKTAPDQGEARESWVALLRKIRKLPKAGLMTPEEAATAANRYLEDFLLAENPDTPSDVRLRILAQVDNVTPEMAEVFRERVALLLSSKSDGPPVYPDASGALLSLMLSGGGEGVALLLKERLQDSGVPSRHADSLRIALGDISGWVVNLQNIPVDQTLANLSLLMTRSTNPLDRRAGASLLGLWNDSKAAEHLKVLITTESNGQVLSAAIKALARTKDASAAEFLRTYSASLARLPDSDRRNVEGWIRYAIEELSVPSSN